MSDPHVDVHRRTARLSTLYLAVVILGVLRAHSWGIKPSDMVEVPLLALLRTVCDGESIWDDIARRLRGSGNAVGAGLDGAYEALVVSRFSFRTELVARSIFRGPIRRGIRGDTRWIILRGATVNLTSTRCSARTAPPSRKRARTCS